MTLKDKLLVAFLIIGIIPSLFIGWIMYYQSDNVINKLLVSNMREKLEHRLLQFDIHGEVDDYEGVTFVVKNGEKAMIDKAYMNYVERLSQAKFYDTEQKVKIAVVDDYFGGVIYNAEENYWLYHFFIVNREHPWIEDVGTIFIKISLIIITLAIGFSLSLSFNITTGIRKLINYTKRVETGDLDFSIEVESNDEIGHLTESFNRMTYRLNELINQTYKLELSENEARLKALQAQISPHFLYNALDTINWSLIDKGDFETSQILGSLSEILRYCIDYKKKMVTIKEEFHQSENYLRIQKNRFEDRFDYIMDIEDGIEEYYLPKLLLQPLVENAVIHGVEKRSKGGLIRVNCSSHEDGIQIIVENNGQPIEHEKLLEIQHQLKHNKKQKGDHIGLVNINDRIKLIFGEEYGLYIESNKQMTKSIMTIGKRMDHDQ